MCFRVATKLARYDQEESTTHLTLTAKTFRTLQLSKQHVGCRPFYVPQDASSTPKALPACTLLDNRNAALVAGSETSLGCKSATKCHSLSL